MMEGWTLHRSPHLDATMRGLAHRQEVRDDVRHQVSAHFHRGVKVILQQAARQLHRLNLRSRNEQVLDQSQALQFRCKGERRPKHAGT